MAAPLLRATKVSKSFPIGGYLQKGGRRAVQILKDVSLEIFEGETLGLVGESGSGKSTLGRTLLRLYQADSGSIEFDGVDISKKSQSEIRPLRSKMQMIFQDPYSSLNPRRRIGDLISDPMRVHGMSDERQIQARLHELMDMVGLSNSFLSRFPHEFSGGQRQRIGIARAIALRPKFIVADEAVSALDVSVQAQVVNLLMDLQEELRLTYLFIAHDLSVVRQISTRTAVMYLGSIVEIGLTDDVLHNPAHPYTAALLSSVPHGPNDPSKPARIKLHGDPPSPLMPPSGCRFHTRCPFARENCSFEPPTPIAVGSGRFVNCHYPLV
ncbi:ABC transporter ATP-binding protein [Mesorhizobium sp. M7A.F.Ca.US.006.01.1.1]|uniref:ABC transporter ATP-binding protein n=1 Tax=Mesorhizobium sp. M7A.F.Ca.US.006.01.1.1 TaxID=2496707 RepID=UPI000FCC5B14|nr:ABC transporter ATP-binding protein [Mesorhizobium sp. M7A.F.Ca.US.006.01.1.1]RUZ76001.1 ABC transporter ATP-binding protein [Mesorhizobium sp. M7A.F.Ca.US.006.01.1.1]